MHGAEVGSLSAQGRLSLLVEASAHLAGTLDLRAVAGALAHSVVPELSDRAEVDLVEALFHPDLSADDVSTVMCRVARVDGARLDDPRAEDEWVAYPLGGAAAVALSTGQTQEDGGGPGDLWALYVPLRARGRVLGVACLRRSAGGSAALPADVSLAEAIASRGAMALDLSLIHI